MNIITNEDCERLLSSWHHDSPQKLINFEIVKLSDQDQVLGFLGEHFILKITYLQKNEENTQSFFLKTLPQNNETHKNYVDKMGIFEKESLIYNNLLNEFSKLASKPFAAKCYLTNTNPNNEFLVLENLVEQSFKVTEGKYLNVKQGLSALETTARFHAASLIFEESKSSGKEIYRINEHFKKEVAESTYSFIEGHPRNMWLKTVTKCLVELSDLILGDKKVGEKIHNYIMRKIPRFLAPSKTYRNVVTHDDLWKNNMMFNDEGKCVLIDFQLARYTPPAFDVMLLFQLCFESNVWRDNFNLFVNHYYSSMEDELLYHNLKPENIFPKGVFLSSLEEYKLPALCEAVMYKTNGFLSDELSQKMISSSELFEDFTFKRREVYIIDGYQNDSELRERYNQLFLPFIELIRNSE